MGFYPLNGAGASATAPEIITSTVSTAALTPANNTEYRYGVLTSLSVSVSDVSDDYTAYIVFTSGTAATELNYPDTIKWSGDDVIDGIFAPLSDRRYNVGLWHDGSYINAVTRGVNV